MTQLVGMFVRHQTGSLAASAIDFSTMIVGVRILELHPALATAWGAANGGMLNFLLGRRWIFPNGTGTGLAPALRYALVSFVSLGLNSAGEYVLVSLIRVQYLLARVLVAIAVGVFWNFPMQRSFVYRSLTAP